MRKNDNNFELNCYKENHFITSINHHVQYIMQMMADSHKKSIDI
jgi:hypothetical protein